MRITENMKFNSSMNSLFEIQDQYNSLLEKMSSQKRINRASDDPVGTTRVIGIKQQQAAITQYRSNVNNADTWVSMAESKLTAANSLIVKAKELATAQATATATASTRKITASDVKGLMDEMLAIANSQVGDRYLFAGTGTEEPFSTTQQAASLGTAQKATDNAFDGTVVSGGSYAGDRNRTYVLKATSGGSLDQVKYVVSSDGGKTWGNEQTGLDNPVVLGDGITMTFTAGTVQMDVDDLFHVKAVAAGYYKGNGDSQSVRIGRGETLDYSISGETAFTNRGQGGADIFRTLHDLQTALENNDVAAISAQLDSLTAAQNSILLNTSQCGTMANRIEIAKSNMDELDQRLTTSLSNTQDADVASLATQYSMKEVALKASYAMAAKIGENTILDYLR